MVHNAELAIHAGSNVTPSAGDKEKKRREKLKRKIHACGPEHRQGALPDRANTWSADDNPAGEMNDGCKTWPPRVARSPGGDAGWQVDPWSWPQPVGVALEKRNFEDWIGTRYVNGNGLVVRQDRHHSPIIVTAFSTTGQGLEDIGGTVPL